MCWTAFEHRAQLRLQFVSALRVHESELGERPTDAVDAGGAVLLDPVAQPVHAQQALLHAPARVHRMNLDHPLGKIDPYSNCLTSCNLIHGRPLSQA